MSSPTWSECRLRADDPVEQSARVVAVEITPDIVGLLVRQALLTLPSWPASSSKVSLRHATFPAVVMLFSVRGWMFFAKPP